MDDQDDAYVYSFKEVRAANYSITQPIQHNCGFPYGNYEYREVIVKVSDVSIEDCEINQVYLRLIEVDKDGFISYRGNTWRYAVLVSNNVELVN